MSDAFLSEMRTFGFNFAPLNWAVANGAIMAISQNTALFSLLGTNYGGDGVRTFALPNVAGNVILGMGAARSGTTYALGETGGTTTVTINTNELPAHTHSFSGDSFRNQGTTNQPSDKTVYGDAQGGPKPFLINTTSPAPTMVAMAPTALTPFGTNAALPHTNQMPTLVLNFCICLQGVFPQRP